MQAARFHLNNFGLIGILAFVVFCFAIGETVAIQVTGWLYRLDYDQIIVIIRNSDANASLIIVLSILSALFRFIVIPMAYFAITDRNLIKHMFDGGRPNALSVMLCAIIMLCTVPLVAFLIEINNKLIFSGWSSHLEAYVSETARQGKRTMAIILSFNDPGDLTLAIFVTVIIPGIAEEIFFRGILQRQIQKTISNHHVVIFIAAFLFTLFHFQFDTFVPKLLLGVILGYLYYWSDNIWYPIVAHITNNSISVLMVYFYGLEILESNTKTSMPIAFVLASFVVALSILYLLKRMLPKQIN